MSAQTILYLCRECATTVGIGDCEEAARLLFGTAAQESAGFVYRRQITPRWDGTVGGFSMWQLEQASIMNGLAQLNKTGVLQEKSARFLYGADWHKAILGGWPGRWDATFAMELLRSNCGDRLGVLLCRLHYLRCPGGIPEGPEAQARYWKQFYNTSAGAGTVEQYLTNWARYCAPVIGR